MKIVMPCELSDFQHPATPGEVKLKMGRTDIGRLLAAAFVVQRIDRKMIVRFAGLGLIAICGIAIHFLYEMVHSGPLHQPTIAEFALALVVVVTGLGGMLMAATGSELSSWKHR